MEKKCNICKFVGDDSKYIFIKFGRIWICGYCAEQ